MKFSVNHRYTACCPLHLPVVHIAIGIVNSLYRNGNSLCCIVELQKKTMMRLLWYNSARLRTRLLTFLVVLQIFLHDLLILCVPFLHIDYKEFEIISETLL